MTFGSGTNGALGHGNFKDMEKVLKWTILQVKILGACFIIKLERWIFEDRLE